MLPAILIDFVATCSIFTLKNLRLEEKQKLEYAFFLQPCQSNSSRNVGDGVGNSGQYQDISRRQLAFKSKIMLLLPFFLFVLLVCLFAFGPGCEVHLQSPSTPENWDIDCLLRDDGQHSKIHRD